MNKALKLIRKFYVYIGARLETENALEILKSENVDETLDSFQFYDRYVGLLNNESQLAKFNENKTFVFLGSGPLPITLIRFFSFASESCAAPGAPSSWAARARAGRKPVSRDTVSSANRNLP